MLDELQLWLAKQAFNSVRVDFYEDLAEALDDQAALVTEIEKVAEYATKQHDLVAPIYKLWLRRLDDRSFSQALIGTVPDSDVMILEASEAANNLSEGLRLLSESIVAISDMKAAVKKAVSGFVFLSILLIALLFLFSFFGIGVIEEVVPAADWPWIGQALRSTARFVTGNSVSIAVIGIGSVILYAWSLPNWRGAARVSVDNSLPFYGIYREFNGALMRVMLASLMKNRVSLTEALEKISKRASPWLRWHIDTIMLRLDYESDQPAKAFSTGIFNRRDTWRFVNYGSRSSFPEAIGKLGLKSMRRTTKSVIESAGKLNKILMVLSGFLIAFIISGTLLTVYEAQNSLQRQMQSVTAK